MTILTNKEVIKEVKKYARKLGLVFAKSKHNNYYHFHDFKTKKIVLDNQTIGVAYENVLSGYIDRYGKHNQKFILK